ncbi:MAG: hypothetical protein VYE73_13985 [Acidobacteriota bacterium]|nr:hypothetical protein [Acidobacteriota bacterium]
MSRWLIGGMVVIGLVIAGLALDRLLLWMESRGWMYWRRAQHRTGGAMGNALMEMQALLQPQARHVVEEQTRVRREESESGDAPSPEEAP